MLQNDPDLEYWNQIILQNPDEDSLYAGRALYLVERHSYDSAIVDYLKAISIDSTQHPEYYLQLSHAYLMAAQSHRAGEVLDQAMRLFPTHKPTLLKVAELKLVLQQYLPALGILNTLFQQDPENADAFYLMGHVYYEMGDTGRAVNAYQRAVDINPEFRQAWIQLGDVLTILKIKRALECYDNALRLDSLDPKVMHNKAYALQALGKKQESLELFRELVVRFPTYEPGFYNLALLYAEADSLDRALEHFNLCIELQPTEPSSYYQRALVYIRLNKKAEAKSDLQNTLNLDPEFEEARKKLEQLK